MSVRDPGTDRRCERSCHADGRGDAPAREDRPGDPHLGRKARQGVRPSRWAPRRVRGRGRRPVGVATIRSAAGSGALAEAAPPATIASTSPGAPRRQAARPPLGSALAFEGSTEAVKRSAIRPARSSRGSCRRAAGRSATGPRTTDGSPAGTSGSARRGSRPGTRDRPRPSAQASRRGAADRPGPRASPRERPLRRAPVARRGGMPVAKGMPRVSASAPGAGPVAPSRSEPVPPVRVRTTRSSSGRGVPAATCGRGGTSAPRTRSGPAPVAARLTSRPRAPETSGGPDPGVGRLERAERRAPPQHSGIVEAEADGRCRRPRRAGGRAPGRPGATGARRSRFVGFPARRPPEARSSPRRRRRSAVRPIAASAAPAPAFTRPQPLRHHPARGRRRPRHAPSAPRPPPFASAPPCPATGPRLPPAPSAGLDGRAAAQLPGKTSTVRTGRLARASRRTGLEARSTVQPAASARRRKRPRVAGPK